MNTYIIKKKRDGQGWKESGFIYADNWQDAKKKFTDNIRNWMATESGVVYLDDDMDVINYPSYIGAGYYNIDNGWMQPDVLLDIDVIDTFSEDVYTYTIKRV